MNRLEQNPRQVFSTAVRTLLSMSDFILPSFLIRLFETRVPGSSDPSILLIQALVGNETNIKFQNLGFGLAQL